MVDRQLHASNVAIGRSEIDDLVLSSDGLQPKSMNLPIASFVFEFRSV
jgi:hypothetical protein